jgi:hypothetical protein
LPELLESGGAKLTMRTGVMHAARRIGMLLG